MTTREQNNARLEYNKLLHAARQRLELERTFGLTDFPLPGEAKNKPAGRRPVGNQQAEPVPGDETEKPTSKAEALAQLKKETERCVRCTLHKTRTNLVFGSGNADAELVFVGEAPGEEEDRQGEPFVGPAGQLLTKMIEAIGMKRSEVYICNVLKSRPPGNRTPLADEIAACLPFLKRQLRIIKPKILCALGATAARTLLGINKPMAALRGRFFDYEGAKLLPTFHPSYLLRCPWEKGKAWEDLKKVRDTLKALRGEASAPVKEVG